MPLEQEEVVKKMGEKHALLDVVLFFLSRLAPAPFGTDFAQHVLTALATSGAESRDALTKSLAFLQVQLPPRPTDCCRHPLTRQQQAIAPLSKSVLQACAQCIPAICKNPPRDELLRPVLRILCAAERAGVLIPLDESVTSPRSALSAPPARSLA